MAEITVFPCSLYFWIQKYLQVIRVVLCAMRGWGHALRCSIRHPKNSGIVALPPPSTQNIKLIGICAASVGNLISFHVQPDGIQTFISQHGQISRLTRLVFFVVARTRKTCHFSYCVGSPCSKNRWYMEQKE